MDRIIKCYALNKKALVTVANTTKLIEEIKNIHDLTPTTSAVLGRVATMGTIMAHTSMKDENENITISQWGTITVGNNTLYGTYEIVGTNRYNENIQLVINIDIID